MCVGKQGVLLAQTSRTCPQSELMVLDLELRQRRVMKSSLVQQVSWRMNLLRTKDLPQYKKVQFADCVMHAQVVESSSSHVGHTVLFHKTPLHVRLIPLWQGTRHALALLCSM